MQAATGSVPSPTSGELHHVVEPAHELHNGLTIGEINTALGHFHFADAVILQVQQADATRVLFDKLNGILAAAVNPVDVQLKAQVFGVVLDDVQQILAVVACELHMVVVVVQIDALFLQPAAVSSASLAKSMAFS